MRELSLNILDIVQNSVVAAAKNILIDIIIKDNIITVNIKDDGRGMSEELLKRVEDPFATTRTTRAVGMGIPLFKFAAESSGGAFKINSKLNEGTTVTATFLKDHIDRMPMGDIADTIGSLIMTKPDIDYFLNYKYADEEFNFSTTEIKEALEGLPIEDLEVISFIKNMIKENISQLQKGDII